MVQMLTTNKDKWNDNLIQFARLICEISANVDICEEDWENLTDSMDLSTVEVVELFDRAHDVWEEAKSNV